MFEKVNPCQPDKVADRIAGALVDLAYKETKNPKIAVEVLIGHGKCHIIAETSVKLNRGDVRRAVKRIAGPVIVDYREYRQDAHLAENQKGSVKCGDNGIFKGVPVTQEQRMENFSGQLKKYKVTINDLLAENEKLEARARASESGKIKDRMERAKLESELHDMQRLVDRIPPDILAELKRQQRQYGKER